MKTVSTKKIIVIFSVLLTIVVTFVLLAFLTGNTKYPSLSNPDGVFYERLDANGDVVYQITNQELFEQIKGNDGVDQSLLLVDAYLLTTYLDGLTDEQIQNKILELKYGTSNADEIAALDADTKTSYEQAYEQSMILAGYVDNEAEFASVILAREIYTRYIIDFNQEITDLNVASEYVNNYFQDIQAIRIRFTSSADATDVMKKFNLLTYNLSTLREYSGYIFTSESLLDNNDAVVEAYTTVTPYYFDESNNILNTSGTIIYTYDSEAAGYTDSSDNEYQLDESGNLVNIDTEVVIANNLLFDSSEAALAYKEANTVYYTVSKVDNFDVNEVAQVKDSEGTVVYTINSDGKIFDTLNVDVTDTTDLIVNKVFTDIKNVSAASLNNSVELSDEEILAKYIEMYNYVYGEYRTTLPTDATVADLIALDDANLTFNYDEVYATQTSLAAYMFKTLNLASEDVLPYSVSPKAYAGANDTNYYMVYKLHQTDKVDAFEIMLDNIEERISVPSSIATDITLPTTGWYDAKIVWYSSNSSVLASDGTVTTPSEDTAVTLTYTITANSVVRSGTILVTVLASGENSAVTTFTDEEVSFKTILNDDTLYDTLYNQLVDDEVYGTNGDTTVSDHMIALRQEYNFTLFDYYVQVDYQGTDTDYVINDKGDKSVWFSVSGRPGAEDTEYTVTADDFFTYAMGKSPSLYLVYASQQKELIYSTFFTDLYGTETDLSKNKSTKMDAMYQQVQDAKDYYAYLAKLYATYGMTFTYSSFADYAYAQYGTKSESDLLAYFVQSSLQPYYIDEAINEYNLVSQLYTTVQDYFDNYFSLNVNHIVIYVDLNEDGTPDNYFDYTAGLTPEELTSFESLIAGLEVVLDDYDDLEQAVTDYRAALRTDETWGVYKQAGINLMWEDLNQTDDNGDAHSVTYSGDYGVKDTYVPEYTTELINLYQEYQLEQNADLENMVGAVTTEFGYHIIQVTPGDDFTKPSAAFTETDAANPNYSDGSENPNDMPTLDQMELYATYFFYNTVYDLTDGNVESDNNISVPKLPATVTSALTVYFDAELQNLYVVGTLNVLMAEYLATGSFQSDSDYCSFTSEELLAKLADVKNVYYQALYGDFVTE
ncbi:MAG: immunoglobulin-like domain-containing protein [Candidatus Izemoplasmatales bacterium]